MKNAAVGFRVHSGWSAVVVVSLELSLPKVLRRERLQLVETYSFKFRQPYHTADKMRGQNAVAFIAGVRSEAEGMANRFLRGIQRELKMEGYALDRGGLILASGRALPELEKILASHALIHTADGELFREAIRAACKRCALNVTAVKEKELMNEGATMFSIRPPDLLRQITEMGKPFGPPWSQDEKLATLAAWLALRGTETPLL
jgi:hypothetical protein